MAVGVSGLLPAPPGYAELLEQLTARVRASRVRAGWRLSHHHLPRPVSGACAGLRLGFGVTGGLDATSSSVNCGAGETGW
jgi:hypothetical protein